MESEVQKKKLEDFEQQSADKERSILKKAIELGGSVTLDLKDYNLMRDTLENVLKTTDTHKEFITKFRKSLAVLVGKSKKAGLDIDPLFEYFQDMKFNPLENVEIVKSNDEPRWKVVITKKKEDEGVSIIND